MSKPNNKYVPAAFAVVKRAMQADVEYAWSWHCNVAMAMVDSGCDHKIANEGAARFMKLCWDVDTSERTRELYAAEEAP